MASTRSDYEEKSSKEPSHESIKYTFAGYGSGNNCTIKTASGESIPAKIQTNGLIQPGAEVCVIKTPEGLTVKGMPTPSAPEPDKPSSVSTGKIKILWTIGPKLYLGGDRRSPLLLKTFPEGSTISGLCHNHGSGDKFAVGVIVSKPNSAGVMTHEQWVFNDSTKGITTGVDGFKSSRVKPIGHGLFADPWLPVNMIDRKFIARTKKGKLIFFSNVEAYEIGSAPPIVTGQAITPIKATVHRTEGSSYLIRIEQGVGASKSVTEIKSIDIESKPKAKIKDWGFLATDELVDDRRPNTFLDPNLTGKSSVSGDRKTRNLKLQTWQSNAKSVFSKVFDCTRTENTFPPAQSRSSNIAQGKIGAGSAAPIELSLRYILDRSVVPNGNQPPPGNDPNMPYKDMYFSFVFDTNNGVSGFTDSQNVWIATAFYTHQLMSSNPNQYGNLQSSPGVLKKHTTIEPHFRIPGVYLGKMTFLEWYRIKQGFAQRGYDVNRTNYPSQQWSGILAPQDGPPVVERSELPEWIDVDTFDQWYFSELTGIPTMPFVAYTGVLFPIFRYLDWYGREQWRSNGWGYGGDSISTPIKTVRWKGFSFLDSLNPQAQPPDAEPSYAPYTIDDHKWADTIVVSENGSVLYKRWLEMKTTGNPPTPIPELINHAVYLKNKSIVKVGGVLPLLSAEDTLDGSKLYRVDRSPLDIAKTGNDKPPRANVKSLNVEAYALSIKTTMSKITEDIYAIPQNAEILSASYHS